MAKVVYFVIGVDLDLKEKFIDDDELMNHFWDGLTIFDTDSGEWLSETETDSGNAWYEEALAILNDKDKELS